MLSLNLWLVGWYTWEINPLPFFLNLKLYWRNNKMTMNTYLKALATASNAETLNKFHEQMAVQLGCNLGAVVASYTALKREGIDLRFINGRVIRYFSMSNFPLQTATTVGELIEKLKAYPAEWSIYVDIDTKEIQTEIHEVSLETIGTYDDDNPQSGEIPSYLLISGKKQV
jgi:hypothetical protein